MSGKRRGIRKDGLWDKRSNCCGYIYNDYKCWRDTRCCEHLGNNKVCRGYKHKSKITDEDLRVE